jgi:hypothetical protein
LFKITTGDTSHSRLEIGRAHQTPAWSTGKYINVFELGIFLQQLASWKGEVLKKIYVVLILVCGPG